MTIANDLLQRFNETEPKITLEEIKRVVKCFAPQIVHVPFEVKYAKNVTSCKDSMKSVKGQTVYRPEKPTLIKIDYAHMVQGGRGGIPAYVEVILHEFAHAMVGPGHGHGPVFLEQFAKLTSQWAVQMIEFWLSLEAVYRGRGK